MLEKIISGGQSGVDIAAIDAAIANSFPYGGMIPKNRKCENGTIPLTYSDFKESKSFDYKDRTLYNIVDADGTLIFNEGDTVTSGTLLTFNYAKKIKKPCIVINVLELDGFFSKDLTVLSFVQKNRIKVLNVAGPRESKCPGIYQKVYNIMDSSIKILIEDKSW